AGRPEGASGKMVLDEVADGLRHYRKEPDEDRRLALLTRLAPSRDPRVAIALGEFLEAPVDVVNQFDAALLVCCHYGATSRSSNDGVHCLVRGATAWCHENEAGLRRPAARLPR